MLVSLGYLLVKIPRSQINDYQTPFSYLKAQLPDIDDKIRFVIPIMLDKVSVQLDPWVDTMPWPRTLKVLSLIAQISEMCTGTCTTRRKDRVLCG
jgi:hypothetical protein